MDIVPRSGPNQLANLAAATVAANAYNTFAPAVRDLAPVARDLTRLVRNLNLRSGGDVTSRTSQKMGVQRGRKEKAGKQRARSKPKQPQARAPKRINNAAVGNPSLGLALTSSSRSAHLDFKFECLVPVTNTGAGTANATMRIALDADPGPPAITHLASYNSRLSTYRGMFRQWHLKGLTIKYVPSLSDNASGMIGTMIDSDTKFGNLGAMTDVLRYGCHSLSNVRMGSSFRWTPTGIRDKEEKYCVRSVNITARGDDELGYGSLAWYSTNSEANGVTVGYLYISGNIKFEEQC